MSCSFSHVTCSYLLQWSVVRVMSGITGASVVLMMVADAGTKKESVCHTEDHARKQFACSPYPNFKRFYRRNTNFFYLPHCQMTTKYTFFFDSDEQLTETRECGEIVTACKTGSPCCGNYSPIGPCHNDCTQSTTKVCTRFY